MEVYFATHNANKLAEVQNMLPDSISLKGLDELNLFEEIPETAETIEGNSLMKTKYVFDKHGVVCFGDDTGLEVEALNGAPGVYSARYAGPDNDGLANMQLLLKNLKGITNRKARFKTVITYFDKSGSSTQFTGTVDGEILDELQGDQGFGYDPIFKPLGYDKTFAQMSTTEKNTISHRARAFKKLVKFLSDAR